MNSPIAWYGGKNRLRNWICKYIDCIEHKSYIEPFAGGASVFFYKQPSPLEVLNDLNGGLVNFFRVLADENDFKRFCRIVEALPWSRELFNEFKDSDQWTVSSEQLTVGSGQKKTDHCSLSTVNCIRAAQWFLVTRQSMSANRRNFGYDRFHDDVMRTDHPRVRVWRRCIDGLPQIHDRLLDAQIEHLDAIDCIKRYDSTKALFYCDPPYVLETRNDKSKKYEHEMTLDQHKQLVKTLLNIKGKSLVSAYQHTVYQPLLDNGWTLTTKQIHCNSAGRVRGSNLQGAGNALQQTRTECLYISPGAMGKGLLF